MPQTKPLSARPVLDQSYSTAGRHLFQTHNSNVDGNLFSKPALSARETKSRPKKSFTVKSPGRKPVTHQKLKNRGVLSAKPARVTKVRNMSSAKILLSTHPAMRHGSNNKPKDHTTIKKANQTKHQTERKARQRAPQSKAKHPLNLAFEGVTLAYETHLKTEGPQALTQAVDDITAQVEAVDLRTSNLLTKYADSIVPLTKPFRDEELLLTLHSGTHDEKKVHVTIGNRIEGFARFMKAKAEKTKTLWAKWESTALEIEKLGADLYEGTDGYRAQAMELDEECRTKQEQILKTFDDDCRKLERKAIDSEKKYESAIDQQRQAIIRYMQLETEIRDMSDDFDGDDGDRDENEWEAMDEDE